MDEGTTYRHAGSAERLLIRDPESPRRAGEPPPLAAPLVVPEHGITYARLAQGLAPARGDGLAVGQLDPVPADVPEVEVFLPAQGRPDQGMVSFALLGSVRYHGSVGQVQVATFRPSVAAAQQLLLLGNTTVRLTDGSAAWLHGNRVAFVKDGLIIAVSGDLGTTRLLALATSVVIR